METERAIRERRSTREFSSKQVKFEDLVKILETARLSPRAGNIETFRFVVVSDPKKKNQLAKICIDQNFIENATYLVVVCSEIVQLKRFYKERSEKYLKQQVGAAIENMLITATSLGLGSCWIGAFDESAIKALLRVPDGYEIEAVVAIGNALRAPSIPKKFDLNMLVYFDVFGKPQGFKEKDIMNRETKYEK